jgi:flagellar protein FlaF
MASYGYARDAYAETVADGGESGRSRELEAFERLVGALERGRRDGAGSAAEIEALRLTRAVWVFLIEEMVNPDSPLDADTRANIGSLGLWSVREVEEISSGRKRGLQPLIDVAEEVREGLAGPSSQGPRR